MPTSKKCIITGRNKLTNIFYMINNDTTDLDNIWNTGGGEEQVRKHCDRKVFESVSLANTFIRKLRSDNESWQYQWGVEYVNSGVGVGARITE